MNKRLHHLDTTEEIDYYSKEMINKINAKISEYNYRDSSPIGRLRRRISLVKHTNKQEVYPFILDNLSYEITKEHLELIDDKQSDKNNDVDLINDNIGSIKVDNNGYANTLYIEALENKDNPYFKIDRESIITENTKPHKKESNDRKELLQKNKKALMDNPFDKIIGDPEDVANQLISNKKLDWPIISWHEGVVMKEKKNSMLSKYLDRFNKNIIDTLPYLHIIVAFFSMLVLLFLVNASILLLEYQEFDTSQFYSSLTTTYIFDIPAIFLIIFLYILLSLIYPITSKVYTWKYFTYYIDDAEKYLGNISRIRKLHIGTFTLYLLYTLLGSIIIMESSYYFINDGDPIYEPMNGIGIDQLVLSIFIPVVLVYYFSIKQYYFIPRSKKMRSHRLFRGFVAFSFLITLNLFTGYATYVITNLRKSSYPYYVDNYDVYRVYFLNQYIFFFTIFTLVLLRFKLSLRDAYDWYNDLRNVNLLQTLISLIIMITLFFLKIMYKDERRFFGSINYGITIFDLIINVGIILVYLVLFYKYFGKIYQFITKDNEIHNNVVISEIIYSINVEIKKIYLEANKLKDKYL